MSAGTLCGRDHAPSAACADCAKAADSFERAGDWIAAADTPDLKAPPAPRKPIRVRRRRGNSDPKKVAAALAHLRSELDKWSS